MNNPIVPEKPSEIIRFAIDALIESEKPDSTVIIDMDVWHDWNPDVDEKRCIACLAGNAAIKRFGLNPFLGNTYGMSSQKRVMYSSVTDGYIVMFYEFAVNQLRIGNVGNAFHHLGLEEVAGDNFNRWITPYVYGDTDKQFKSDMLELASDLEQAGY